jgi:hypothetical protein
MPRVNGDFLIIQDDEAMHIRLGTGDGLTTSLLPRIHMNRTTITIAIAISRISRKYLVEVSIAFRESIPDEGISSSVLGRKGWRSSSCSRLAKSMAICLWIA